MRPEYGTVGIDGLKWHIIAAHRNAAVPLSGHTKTLHTPIGMGSAALAAAVLYPGKATRISYKGH